MMELDEETSATPQRDKMRIAHITQSSDITNPAKLVFWNNHLYWLKDAEDWKSSDFGSQGETSHIEATVPLLRCESSIADTNSVAGSQKWERLPAGNGTSGSSIDLEWENEAGLTPPPHFIIPTTDDLTWLGLSDISSNHSHPSTPVSNGNDLEWDFTSVPANEDEEKDQETTTVNNKTENGNNIER